MILEVSSQLVLDVINKGLEIFKILLKINLELWLYNNNAVLVVVLILGLSKADNIIKK